jgi:hypothetical protein
VPFAARAAGVRPNSLAVMDTVSQNVPESMAALTTQTLSSYAANTLGLDVVAKDDLKRLVSFQQLQQLAGCDGDTCSHAAELAQQLGVERIMTSTLGRIGDRFQLSVVVMDTASGRVSGRATREILSEDEITENARDLAHFAIKHEQRESKGYIRITVNVTAAKIDIDGAQFGVSPLPTPARVLAGTHKVHVEKEGFLQFDGAIDVEVGKESHVDVSLIAKKDIKVAGAGYLPWAGVTLGLAVAGGAVSIYGYYTALNKCKEYELDSVLCATGKPPNQVTYTGLNQAKQYVAFWGNGVAFYGGIASGVVGAVSVALFTAYFITGLGAGGDEPLPLNTVHLEPTPGGLALRF